MYLKLNGVPKAFGTTNVSQEILPVTKMKATEVIAFFKSCYLLAKNSAINSDENPNVYC